MGISDRRRHIEPTLYSMMVWWPTEKMVFSCVYLFPRFIGILLCSVEEEAIPCKFWVCTPALQYKL